MILVIYLRYSIGNKINFVDKKWTVEEAELEGRDRLLYSIKSELKRKSHADSALNSNRKIVYDKQSLYFSIIAITALTGILIGLIFMSQKSLDTIKDQYISSNGPSSRDRANANSETKVVVLNQIEVLRFYGILFLFVSGLALFSWILSIRSQSQNVKYRRAFEILLEEEKHRTIQASRLSTLGEMAGGIAHEINNPLTIILGNAEILERQLQKGTFDKEKFLKLSQGIISTTGRIASIVNALKVYARDDSNAPFRLAELSNIIEDTLNICLEKLKNQNIAVKFTPGEEPIFLMCREVQLSQVLLNLIHNSYDAILYQDTQKWIRIETCQLGQICQIRVTDSGQGISEKIQEKMLNPFFTTKGIGKGTGLGLSISQSIVSEHRGKFYYDDKQSNTSFVIELPMATRDQLSESGKTA